MAYFQLIALKIVWLVPRTGTAPITMHLQMGSTLYGLYLLYRWDQPYIDYICSTDHLRLLTKLKRELHS